MATRTSKATSDPTTMSTVVTLGLIAFGEAIRTTALSQLGKFIDFVTTQAYDDDSLSTAVEAAFVEVKAAKNAAKIAKTAYALVIGLWAVGYRTVEHAKSALDRKGYAVILDKVQAWMPIYQLINRLFDAGVKMRLSVVRAYFRELFERTGDASITPKSAKRLVFAKIAGQSLNEATYLHFVEGVKTTIDGETGAVKVKGFLSRLDVLKGIVELAKKDDSKAHLVPQARFDVQDIVDFDACVTAYKPGENESPYSIHKGIRTLANDLRAQRENPTPVAEGAAA